DVCHITYQATTIERADRYLHGQTTLCIGCPFHLENPLGFYCSHPRKTGTVAAMDRNPATQRYVSRDRLRPKGRTTARQGRWQIADTLDLDRRLATALARSGTNWKLVGCRLGGCRCRSGLLDRLWRLFGVQLAKPRTHFRPAMGRCQVTLFGRKPV